MLQLNRIDKVLAELEKPKLNKIDQINLEPEDIYITCIGFEDRAIEGLSRINSADNFTNNVLLIDYLPFEEENKIEKFKHTCKEKILLNQIICYDRENPEGFGDITINKIEGFSGRVYLDISGMSRILLVQLLVAIGKYQGHFNVVSIIYSEANVYPPNQGDVEKQIKIIKDDPMNKPWETKSFISSGVFGVSIIPELSSFAMIGKPTRLIIFPSFDPLQLISLKSELQPTFISFVHGIPHLEKDIWRTNAIRELNHIEDISNKDECYVSTFSYQETMNKLLKIYESKNVFEKLLISPTGSKMQAVAVGIIRSYLDDIQIVYPTPKSFQTPEKYTEGVNQMYSLSLDSFPSIPS